MPKPITVDDSNRQKAVAEGLSIVAGQPGERPVADTARLAATFKTESPLTGSEIARKYLCASVNDVERAGHKAWEAYYAMLDRPPIERVKLILTIADRLELLGDRLIEIAHEETGIGQVRLVAEREKAVENIKLFARSTGEGDLLRASIDPAEPSRRPVPKPDLRKILRAVGPVAVFGPASSPIAGGVAGVDVISALAAGCPVLYKGHPSHPGTCEMLAQAISGAVSSCGFHPGVFSMLHAGGSKGEEVARRLMSHPCVRAGAFTGSAKVGHQLAALAASRDDPIPVHATMGSLNPVFVLPSATAIDAQNIAERLFFSIANAGGQSCTRPGVIFLARGGETETLVRALSDAMNRAEPQPMLSRAVRGRYIKRLQEIQATDGIELRGGSPQGGHSDDIQPTSAGMPIRASGALFRTRFDVFRSAPTLHEEVFGPCAIVVITDSTTDLVDAAASIQGSLTGSIWSAASDAQITRQIALALEQRVGRIIFNGLPIGIESCDSIVHGGPFPVSTTPGFTAAGPEAVLRWQRPICYQNAPEVMLPQELRSANPLGLPRLVKGQVTLEPLREKRSSTQPKAA
jgi:NADP-dependent aldehyde dehydrogenase